MTCIGQTTCTSVVSNRSERMGQLKSIDLPEPGARGVEAPRSSTRSKARWWLWILILGVIAVGVWYFRGARSSSQAADSAAPGAAAKGRGGAGAGGFVVPGVVATPQRGDFPAYFNGPGPVTPFNTAPV